MNAAAVLPQIVLKKKPALLRAGLFKIDGEIAVVTLL